jgi:hypothetical protein
MGDQTQTVMPPGEDRTAAELRSDTSFFEKILADDFVGVGPRGCSLTQDQRISRRDAGSSRYESFGPDEVQVRLEPYPGQALRPNYDIARERL